MKITKDNYEQYLIDLMDGKLNPSMKDELFVFLDQHPEIKAEFEDMEIISTAVDQDVHFSFKDKLKKPAIHPTKNIHKKNYEEYFIASIELDLTDSQRNELQEFLKLNPTLENTFKLYQKTKAQPDLSTKFPDKRMLKKYPFYQRKAWIYSASVAASLLLLISILFFKQGIKIDQKLSSNERDLVIPSKMTHIIAKSIIIDKNQTKIKLEYKNVVMPLAFTVKDSVLPYEKIELLKIKVNIKEQLTSLQPNFQAPASIQPVTFEDYAKSSNVNEVLLSKNNHRKKNNRVIKAIKNGLFAKLNLKNNKRKPEGGTDNKNKKKVNTLWVLANIGLEQVNQITGTDMRINLKNSEEKHSEDEKTTRLSQ